MPFFQEDGGNPALRGLRRGHKLGGAGLRGVAGVKVISLARMARADLKMSSRSTSLWCGSARWFFPAAVMTALAIFTVGIWKTPAVMQSPASRLSGLYPGGRGG
jgi:hypothetical protein